LALVIVQASVSLIFPRLLPRKNEKFPVISLFNRELRYSARGKSAGRENGAYSG
jgi:hypothetical protein